MLRRWAISGPALAVVTLVLSPAIASAFVELPPNLYTRPQPPSAATLARLNLKMGWYAYLPVESGRDGVILVQPIGNQVFAQLRSGQIIALDAASGQPLWRKRVGLPYPVIYRLGHNDRLIFVVNGARLYGLSRLTGEVEFEQEMPTAPSGPVLADAERTYITLGANRLVAYELPRVGENLPTRPRPTLPPGLSEAVTRERQRPTPEELDTELLDEPIRDRSPEMAATTSVMNTRQMTPSLSVVPTVIPPYQLSTGTATPSLSVVPTVIPPYVLDIGARTPSISVVPSVTQLARLSERNPPPELEVVWEYQPGLRMENPPVVAGNYLLQASAGRDLFATLADRRQIFFEFRAISTISGPLGQYRDIAYVPTNDESLYSLDIPLGKVLWRVTSPGVSRRRPVASDADLFVSTETSGLVRLDRSTGNLLWTNPDISRLLAVGPRFLYGLSPNGRLQVVDLRRGRVLGTLDTREFVVPVENETDDRVYMAAHNGLLISLHDQSLPSAKPLQSPPPKPRPKRADDEQPAAPATDANQ